MKAPKKILLLELSGSDSCARQPSRYSGCGPTFRRLVENLENCYLAAEESCFEGDVNEKCVSLTREDINSIKNGSKLFNFKNDIFGQFDVVVYSNPSLVLNTSKPQICWAVGQNEKVYKKVKYLLLHDKSGQNPIIENHKTKIFEFVLGISVPMFEVYQKQDFILQVTNHYPQINSNVLARWALKYKIKTIFAGPISEKYQLLDYIDYESTFYLGEIKQEEKIKLLKKAKLISSVYSFPINGPPLFCKEGLGFGCGLLSARIPSIEKILKEGHNGFFVLDEASFVDAWNHRHYIDQKDCWNTANKWNLNKMVFSFQKVIDSVLNEN